MSRSEFPYLFLGTLLFLGVLQESNGRVVFTGLPNTVNKGTPYILPVNVTTFQVSTPGTLLGNPVIINSNPLTQAFEVSCTGSTHCQVNMIKIPQTTEVAINLQIFAQDNMGSSAMQVLSVFLNVGNKPPIFLDNMADQAVIVYITENSPPGYVYGPLVYDLENDPLKYSMSPASSVFAIDQSTGAITTSKIFNYETDPHSYTLEIIVTDGINTINGSLLVYILNTNDEQPYFTISGTTTSIPEEQPIGTVVKNVTAIDPDDFNYLGFLQYSISPIEYFTIDPYTGLIKVAQRIDREAKPLRQNPLITVQVTVIDSPTGGQSNTITLTFNITDINDNPPICNPDTYRVPLLETTTIGAQVARITCTDIDVDPANNQFIFKDLTCSGCNDFMYALSPPSSSLIVLNGSLDMETTKLLYYENSLSVTAQDVAYPYFQDFAYIYVTVIPVNEYAPQFNRSSYVCNVSECTNQGASVTLVTATDKDIPNTGITYSIESGGSTFDYSNIFWINPSTGEIRLVARPNYEITPVYVLTVIAVDGDPINPLTGTTTVAVNIIEQNDEPPVCTPNNYELIIPYDLKTGANIQFFKLTCTDLDSSPKAFRYSISSGNINNHFTFSPTQGSNITELILSQPFNYASGVDKDWNYKLLVYITDDNPPYARPGCPGIGTVTIYVSVVIPGLTTRTTTTPPSITYIVKKENSYSSSGWYIPFVIALGAMILLGILGYLFYHCIKYLSKKDCCVPKPEKYKEPLIPPSDDGIKKEVVMELTKINTVFDGEAVDPVTGKIYEYNTKSGARRWKETQVLKEPQPVQPESSVLVIPAVPPTANLGKERTGTGNSKRPESKGSKNGDDKNTVHPGSQNLLQKPEEVPQERTSSQASKKEKNVELYSGQKDPEMSEV
ncbi:cadherin-related family member 3-like [Polypterus senegalus]|uniref:cadherin-related family member 3-like n=1 Tax=Polypterus senegalus TaxID=55291 RepID=UPI0019660A17|nr:cadherin-related family member 3-like [Polypterus senegalus]